MVSSFKGWLESHTTRNINVGRFARDVARDATSPPGVSMHECWTTP
jgi:hypothetical protein